MLCLHTKSMVLGKHCLHTWLLDHGCCRTGLVRVISLMPSLRLPIACLKPSSSSPLLARGGLCSWSVELTHQHQPHKVRLAAKHGAAPAGACSGVLVCVSVYHLAYSHSLFLHTLHRKQ